MGKATVAGWARHEHARTVLEEVLLVCKKSGIEVVAVKGVLTARWLYQDPSERWIQDIDLRVAPRDLRRLKEAGSRAGWEILDWSPVYRNIVFRVQGLMAEFEGHIGPRGVAALPVSEFLARATEHVAPFGFSHLQPELHDHALLLILNVFKDKIVEASEGAVQDLERVAALKDFDPERLAALAKRANVSTIAFLVAEWLVGVRGASAWQPVLRALGRPPRRHFAALFRRLMPWPDSLGLRLLARAASDGRMNQVVATGTTAAWLVERAVFGVLAKASS